MYASKNFKTKKEFREAVERGDEITLWSPGLGSPKTDGTEYVEGPQYPLPHKWYAQVTVESGIVKKVR